MSGSPPDPLLLPLSINDILHDLRVKSFEECFALRIPNKKSARGVYVRVLLHEFISNPEKPRPVPASEKKRNKTLLTGLSPAELYLSQPRCISCRVQP